jgi:hypothetical protein
MDLIHHRVIYGVILVFLWDENRVGIIGIQILAENTIMRRNIHQI